MRYGRVAQLVRAPVLQTGGRGFESLRAHHVEGETWLFHALLLLITPLKKASIGTHSLRCVRAF